MTPRARERLQLSERDRVDQQDGSGPRTAHGPGSHVDHGHEAEGRLGHTPARTYVAGRGFSRLQRTAERGRGLFWEGGSDRKNGIRYRRVEMAATSA